MYFCLPLFLSNSGLSDKRLPLAQISLHPFLNSHGITLWRSWSTDQEITILAKTFSWLTSMLLIIHSYSLTKVVLSLRFISWTILNNSCSFFFSVPPLPPPPPAGYIVFVHSVCINEESCSVRLWLYRSLCISPLPSSVFYRTVRVYGKCDVICLL